MKKIKLSDVLDQQLRAAQQKREADLHKVEMQHKKLCDDITRKGADSADHFLALAKKGEIYSASGSLLDWMVSYSKVLPGAPAALKARVKERQLAARLTGVEKVLQRIETQLDKSVLTYDCEYDYGYSSERVAGNQTRGSCSIAISGYCNDKGEIDLIVLSPWGLVAIEVKNIAGYVYNRGHEWFRDRYDARGNRCHHPISIHDAGGRGPAQQLSEPTKALETYLAANSCRTPVRRAIVLAHPHAVVGDIDRNHNAVDLVTHVGQLDLVSFLSSPDFSGPCCFDESEIGDIACLVEAHHMREAQRHRQ